MHDESELVLPPGRYTIRGVWNIGSMRLIFREFAVLPAVDTAKRGLMPSGSLDLSDDHVLDKDGTT